MNNNNTMEFHVNNFQEIYGTEQACIALQFAEMYDKDGNQSDLTIVAEDRKFKVHKFCLATGSPFWEKKLFEEQNEGSAANSPREITVQHSKQVMDIVLRYLYIQEIYIRDLQLATAVADAAKEYKIDGLTTVCDNIIANLSKSSSASLLSQPGTSKQC